MHKLEEMDDEIQLFGFEIHLKDGITQYTPLPKLPSIDKDIATIATNIILTNRQNIDKLHIRP